MQAALPVKFPVTVDGNRLMATAEKINDHVIHSSFLIRFSDGYQDSFHDYTDNKIRGLQERVSHVYALALKDDFAVLKLLTQENTRLQFFSWQLEGVNGWLVTAKQKEKQTDLYTVYISSKYRFDIWEKEGSWVVNADRAKDPVPIDRALAEHAVSLIGKTPALPKPNRYDKEIEFELEFVYRGATMKGSGLLLPVKPFAQVNIGIQTGTTAKPHIDMYQFFKIDAKEKIFAWTPCAPDKEPVAKAIAAVLEKKFAVHQVFAAN